MSLPKKLKRMSVFNDGSIYQGETKSMTVPKLGRKMEDYRGGGMSGSVKIDHGMETMECEHEYGGFMPDFMRQWGATTVDAVQLRFMGGYQNDQTGGVDAIEITMLRPPRGDRGGRSQGRRRHLVQGQDHPQLLQAHHQRRRRDRDRPHQRD